jgi:hypothetical protein
MPFDYDAWCAAAVSSWTKRYPTCPPLVHTSESVYEGSTFPPGRRDFFSCERWKDNDGNPISVLVGLETMEIEMSEPNGKGSPTTDDYVCVIMETAAYQSQDSRRSISNPYPFLDWVVAKPL